MLEDERRQKAKLEEDIAQLRSQLMQISFEADEVPMLLNVLIYVQLSNHFVFKSIFPARGFSTILTLCGFHRPEDFLRKDRMEKYIALWTLSYLRLSINR